MYPDGGSGWLWVVLGLVICWLVVVSFLLWKIKGFLKKLFPEQGDSFQQKLEEGLTAISSLEEFKKQSLDHVQKVGLKRFNPYQDTGGDQSFSVAFLDGKDNGVILTSLHSRAGTRIFAKPVKAGGEDKFQFSQEEKEVVKEASNSAKKAVR